VRECDVIFFEENPEGEDTEIEINLVEPVVDRRYVLLME
jgi:hypothetical protein